MKIIPQRNFSKHFKKLPPHVQEKVDMVSDIFEANPFDVRLHNHALSGPMNGLHAISVTADIRIIFQEFFHYKIVLFLDIGTHNQVY